MKVHIIDFIRPVGHFDCVQKFCCNAAKEQGANKFNELLRTSPGMLCGSYNRMYSFKLFFSCAFFSRRAAQFSRQIQYATGWTVKVRFMAGARNFFFFKRPALETVQPLIQWVPESLSKGIKRSRRQSDYLCLSSAEVKNAWSYTSAAHVCLHNVDTDLTFFTFSSYSRGNVCSRLRRDIKRKSACCLTG